MATAGDQVELVQKSTNNVCRRHRVTSARFATGDDSRALTLFEINLPGSDCVFCLSRANAKKKNTHGVCRGEGTDSDSECAERGHRARACARRGKYSSNERGGGVQRPNCKKRMNRVESRQDQAQQNQVIKSLIFAASHSRQILGLNFPRTQE